jgi:hypothetical protein
VDTAGRIWEGDSVQLATKEVSLTLIPWMRGAGRIPGAAERLARQSYRRGCECNRDFSSTTNGTAIKVRLMTRDCVLYKGNVDWREARPISSFADVRHTQYGSISGDQLSAAYL